MLAHLRKALAQFLPQVAAEDGRRTPLRIRVATNDPHPGLQYRLVQTVAHDLQVRGIDNLPFLPGAEIGQQRVPQEGWIVSQGRIVPGQRPRDGLLRLLPAHRTQGKEAAKDLWQVRLKGAQMAQEILAQYEQQAGRQRIVGFGAGGKLGDERLAPGNVGGSQKLFELVQDHHQRPADVAQQRTDQPRQVLHIRQVHIELPGRGHRLTQHL